MASGTKVADVFVDIGYDLANYRKGLAQAKTEGLSLGGQIKAALSSPAGGTQAYSSGFARVIQDIRSGTGVLQAFRNNLPALARDLGHLSVSGLHRGLEALGGVGRRVFHGLKSAAESVFKGLAVGAGIAGFLSLERVIERVTEAFPELINRGKEWAEAIHTITLATGASAEEASKQAAIYKYLGGSTDQYTTQVVRLSARIKANEHVLNTYGVATRNVNGDMLDTITLVDNLRKVFSKLPDGPDKTAIAFKLFGQRGAQMFGPLIHFLGLTDDQVNLLGEDATKQGLVISENSTKIADEVEKSQNRVQNAITGLATQLFTTLGPAITSFFDSLSETITANSGKIREVLGGIATGIIGFIEGLAGITPAAASFSEQFPRIEQGGKNVSATLVDLELKLEKLQGQFQASSKGRRTLAAIKEIEDLKAQIAEEKRLIAEAGDEVADTGEEIHAHLTPELEAARQKGLQFADDFKTALGNVVGAITSVSEALGHVFDGLRAAWDTIPSELKGVVAGAVAGAAVGGLPGAVVGAIGGGALQLNAVNAGNDEQRRAILEQAKQYADVATSNEIATAIAGLTAQANRLPHRGKVGSPEFTFIQSVIDELRKAKPRAERAAEELGATVPEGVATAEGDTKAAAENVANAVPDAITDAIPRSRQAMLDLLHAVANAVTETREGLDSEITKINELSQKPTITPTKELTNLLKARTSPLLLELLKSPDLQKRTAARALAADLDDAISKARPRPGTMSATSKAIVEDLKNTTNPELKAFGEWFQAQLLIQANPPAPPAGSVDALGHLIPSKGSPAEDKAGKAIHTLLQGALNSADPFIKNDAENEGRSFASSVAVGIADAQSKAAAEKAIKSVFDSVINWLKSPTVHQLVLDAWHIATGGLTFELPSFLTSPQPRGYAVDPNTGKKVIRDGGGEVAAWQPYWKDPRQTELFVPSVDGNIVTVGQLGSMLSGQRSGSTTEQKIYIDTVNLADAGDEMSVVDRLRFLALVG